MTYQLHFSNSNTTGSLVEQELLTFPFLVGFVAFNFLCSGSLVLVLSVLCRFTTGFCLSLWLLQTLPMNGGNRCHRLKSPLVTDKLDPPAVIERINFDDFMHRFHSTTNNAVRKTRERITMKLYLI
jgi:hypothetical protein